MNAGTNRGLAIGVGALVVLILFVIGGIAFDRGDDSTQDSEPITWTKRERTRFVRDCQTGYVDYLNTGQVTHTRSECICWVNHVEGWYNSYRHFSHNWDERTGRLPRKCA